MKIRNLDFLGYPLYDICDDGTVISLSFRGHGKENAMKPHKDTKGYYQVKLRNESGSRQFIIHRLVAMAFIPNPDNLPQINHKDEVKTNNHVSNLEWCTNDYNIHYGTGTKRTARTLKGRPNDWLRKKVEQLDLDGNHIAFFDGVREAERKTGARQISRVCLKKPRYYTSGGYKWRYV